MKKSTKCRKCKEPLTPENHSPAMKGICRRCHNLKGAKWRKRNPERTRELDRFWHAEHRAVGSPFRQEELRRHRCHCRVNHALKKGWLKRPAHCEVFGCKVRRVVAHHDDYSKPLAVRWLCRGHHAEHHRLCKGPPPAPPIKLKGRSGLKIV
jgi:hypothetical protein